MFSQGGGGGGDFLEQIKGWWANCPLFTKFLVYSTFGCTIFSFFTDIFFYMFANFPTLSLGGFQIWRIFTSPFVSSSILEILFVYLAYMPMVTKQEREWGTVKTIFDFMLKNIETNILFGIGCYILSVLSAAFLKQYSSGLWCIFFINLVMRCMQDPEGLSMILCLPVQVKNKYYPLVLLLFFTLLSGRLNLSMLAAVGVGYLHLAYLDGFYAPYFNDTKYSNWENSSFGNFLKGYSNFVPLGGSSGGYGGAQNQNQNMGGFRPPQQTPSQPTQSFTRAQQNPFGGRGVAIGGNDVEAQPKPSRSNNYAQLDESDEERQ